MKVVLAVVGSRGDVQPMVSLGEELLRRGHEAVIVAPADFEVWVKGRGLSFVPGGHDMQALLRDNQDVLRRGTLAVFRFLGDMVLRDLEAQHRGVEAAAERADLFVGATGQIAAASVAEAHGRPYRFVAYAPTMLRSPEHAPFVFPAHGLPRWVNRALWSGYVRAIEGKLRQPENQHRARLGLPPLRSVFGMMIPDEVALATDPELGPAPRVTHHRVIQTGACRIGGVEPLPAPVLQFLAAGPAPLYVGFGSMPDPDPDATTARVVEAVEKVGARAILSRGWGNLGRADLPPSCLAVGSLSHPLLFPKMAAVVHHGGAGTTAEAARAGVPQMAIPHAGDQLYWGKRVEALGVGPPPLRKERLTVKALAERFRQLIESAPMKDVASQLGRRLIDADGVSSGAARLADWVLSAASAPAQQTGEDRPAGQLA